MGVIVLDAAGTFQNFIGAQTVSVNRIDLISVSYTHLDVYKRQIMFKIIEINICICQIIHIALSGLSE